MSNAFKTLTRKYTGFSVRLTPCVWPKSKTVVKRRLNLETVKLATGTEPFRFYDPIKYSFNLRPNPPINVYNRSIIWYIENTRRILNSNQCRYINFNINITRTPNFFLIIDKNIRKENYYRHISYKNKYAKKNASLIYSGLSSVHRKDEYTWKGREIKKRVLRFILRCMQPSVCYITGLHLFIKIFAFPADAFSLFVFPILYLLSAGKEFLCWGCLRRNIARNTYGKITISIDRFQSSRKQRMYKRD